MDQKTVNTYETLFVSDLTGGEEAAKATVEKFKGIIAANAEIEEVNEWGKRRFEYPINDKNEGYYTLVTFKSAPEFPAELERLFKINDGIMRSMVIRTEDNDAEAITYESKITVEPVVEAAAEEAVEETVEEAPAAEEAVAENTEA